MKRDKIIFDLVKEISKLTGVPTDSTQGLDFLCWGNNPNEGGYYIATVDAITNAEHCFGTNERLPYYAFTLYLRGIIFGLKFKN